MKSKTKLTETIQVEANQHKVQLFNLLGQFDIRAKKIGNRTIFVVGQTRVGKSTIFNFINNVLMCGVKEEKGNRIIYSVRIQNADYAYCNNGIKSLTLLPNIVQKDGFILADMAGFKDQRHYAQVVGVSYVLKAAFQTVKTCQFLFVTRAEFLQNESNLFQNINGFINMFNFKQMSEESKQSLLKSVTLAFTRADPQNNSPQQCAEMMKNFAEQLQDAEYGGQIDSQNLIYFLQYFSGHPEQIYSFYKAILNQDTPQCKIVEQHFLMRQDFQMQNQNSRSKQQRKQQIFKLPLAQYIENIKNKKQKQQLKKKIQQRISSYQDLSKVLEKFFHKAINENNSFDRELSFKQQFEQIKKFNQRHDVYAKQFNINEQTGLNNIFSLDSPPCKLQTGIRLALNVFQLYKLFKYSLDFQNQSTPQKLLQFMQNYKQHLIIIIDLFRNSFCSSYSEEQMILKFLFIAVRGCRQLSMLYQLIPGGMCGMCMQLKDSFQSIFQQTGLKSIQIQFIKQTNAKKEDILGKLQPEQIKIYTKYIKDIIYKEGYSDIGQIGYYKQLKKYLLEKMPYANLQQKLISLYSNLKEHGETVSQKINLMNDEQSDDDNYPQQLNFRYYHLLLEIGHTLLDLQRGDTLEEDKFAYDNQDLRQDTDTTMTIKQKLTISQATLAKDIFIYVGCVQSTCQAYQFIISIIPQTNYAKVIEWTKGFAKYCSKNGRTQQAIVLFQRALKLCCIGNRYKDFLQLKINLSQVETRSSQNTRSYFSELKKKRIIDSSDDRFLQQIIQSLEDDFVTPFQEGVKQDEF